MTLQIQWIPALESVEAIVPLPKPAKHFIPEWYKKTPPPPSPKKFVFDENGMVKNLGIKACVPFLDALTNGYIQESWTDIHFTSSFDGEFVGNYNYSTGPRILSHRENGTTHFDIPSEFYKTELVWKTPWVPKMPKGYSMLYTHPLNNFELPFLCLDGIVDSDNYYHEYEGQFPFLLKKGFEGIIPAGTPLYQMIPIKRENWESKQIPFNDKENMARRNQIRRYFTNGYRRAFWEKKHFN